MDNRPTGVATEMAAQLLQGKEKTLLAELVSSSTAAFRASPPVLKTPSFPLSPAVLAGA